jgi:hypothetical protein
MVLAVERQAEYSKPLTATREGAWLVNISKHLVTFAPNIIELAVLENAFFAGKCGALLIKLSADETEQLTRKKVRAHAQICGVSGTELPIYLQSLKLHECLDWNEGEEVYEVLPFSRERVLDTTSKIFRGAVAATDAEKALPALLEFCLLRPRLHMEVKDFLCKSISEKEADRLLEIVTTFNLLGVEVLLQPSPVKLYYNEYQFGERDQLVKAGSAIAELPAAKKSELNDLLEAVASKPGTPPESVPVADETKQFAIAVGLIEMSEVASPAGSAKFLTMPRLPVPSVGKQIANLEDDVFHHSKMLLSSLRFGELRSSPSRGRIIEPHVLVSALLDRDRVGPCTAIGEDYVILEAEGVIKTVRAADRRGNQFYMELRRREPAEVVLNLLKSDGGRSINTTGVAKNLELPLQYTGPEAARPVAAKRTKNQNTEALKLFLEALRT